MERDVLALPDASIRFPVSLANDYLRTLCIPNAGEAADSKPRELAPANAETFQGAAHTPVGYTIINSKAGPVADLATHATPFVVLGTETTSWAAGTFAWYGSSLGNSSIPLVSDKPLTGTAYSMHFEVTSSDAFRWTLHDGTADRVTTGIAGSADTGYHLVVVEFGEGEATRLMVDGLVENGGGPTIGSLRDSVGTNTLLNAWHNGSVVTFGDQHLGLYATWEARIGEEVMNELMNWRARFVAA